MKKVLIWIDNHLLEFLAIFLIVFIPTYPKFPLFDLIPGYIVRARLEDILVLIAFFTFCVYVVRKKVNLRNNPLTWPIIVYAIVGLLSCLSAIFVTQSVPLEVNHVGKMFLHYFRRLEYFSLFFIVFSSVKTVPQVKRYIYAIFIVMLIVSIYGFAQKYMYFPAFSTMNREFSKGWALYLTEHARVLSTFGGHYDLAAYLMMTLTLVLGFILTIKARVIRIALAVLYAFSFWILILTASRISFLAYLGSISLCIGGVYYWDKKLPKAIISFAVVMSLSLIIMISFGDLSSRFSGLIKNEQLNSIIEKAKNPFTTKPTQKAQFLENNPESPLAVSDQQPTPTKPSDVINEQPIYVVATNAAGESTLTAVPRQYSENALKYDLSTAIRLDKLWPQAINGFKANPIFGSGYSTLTKSSKYEFTEAESTDNDYLRALGETGLAGFTAFFGILGYVLFISFRALKKTDDPVLAGTLIGISCAVLGLMANALYIDIFEASKVAFTLWAMVAILIATAQLILQQSLGGKTPKNRKK